MTPDQLAFNIAVRNWAESTHFSVTPAGTDERIIVKYCDLAKQQLLSDEDLEDIRRAIVTKLRDLALQHNVETEIEFSDLGYGDLGAIIHLKEPMGRNEAQEEYYDLLYLGPRRTDEQYNRLQTLIRKYGFK